MVTTAEIAEGSGLAQRTVQKRIKRLGIQVQKIGKAFVLTLGQAERVLADNRTAGRPPRRPVNGNGHK